MISGHTVLIPHLGDPIEIVKSPLIYNPYFQQQGIDAAVVPMGVRAGDYPATLRALLAMTNVRGAIITMPHKVSTVALLDACSPAVLAAGACNAVRREPDGRLTGDMFDGAGFVAGMRRNGHLVAGRRALIVGAGGVASAIGAALAAAGVASLTFYDVRVDVAEAIAARLGQHYPSVRVHPGNPDARGHDIIVNATPLGIHETDPLPLDVSTLDASMFVGEVVMAPAVTPLLREARDRGCAIQPGLDMLFEQIPLYLSFFGFPPATADDLRAAARLP